MVEIVCSTQLVRRKQMRRIEKRKCVRCTASQFDVGQLFLTFPYAVFLLPLWEVRVIMILVDSQHNWRGIDQWHR